MRGFVDGEECGRGEVGRIGRTRMNTGGRVDEEGVGG